jgi:hypothetical protein
LTLARVLASTTRRSRARPAARASAPLAKQRRSQRRALDGSPSAGAVEQSPASPSPAAAASSNAAPSPTSGKLAA